MSRKNVSKIMGYLQTLPGDHIGWTVFEMLAISGLTAGFLQLLLHTVRLKVKQPFRQSAKVVKCCILKQVPLSLLSGSYTTNSNWPWQRDVFKISKTLMITQSECHELYIQFELLKNCKEFFKLKEKREPVAYASE